MLDGAVNHGAVYDGQILYTAEVLSRLKVGSSTVSQNSVIFGFKSLRQKTSEGLFEGLYL